MNSPKTMIDRQHLDKNERHFHIPGSSPGLKMHVSYLPAIINFPRMAKVVLYVHGGTFPSTLSIAYRNDDGRSWRDVLADAGSHVWGLDFQGFGDSDPYPEMSQPADDSPALGQAQSASEQLETAVRFICSYHRINALSRARWAARVFCSDYMATADRRDNYLPWVEAGLPGGTVEALHG
jgi:pimeloyl-ACP methyl ester carboxylesterase